MKDSNFKMCMVILAPFTLTMLATAISFVLVSQGINAKLPVAYKESTKDMTIYHSFGIDIIEYNNSLKMDTVEELQAIYNTEAGNIDNWSEQTIVYEEYQRYKDDFIYVNGEIASSEDFDTYLEYIFDNDKKLTVLKEDIGDREYSTYSHDISETSKLISEETNETDNTITRTYDNSIVAVYNVEEMLVSTEDKIRTAQVNVGSIIITYIVLLATAAMASEIIPRITKVHNEQEENKE